MKICYVPRRFSAESRDVIEKAESVCDNYARQGYDLTLRQLFYQFVSKAWIPNTQREYDRIGAIINDARLAGLIDWDHLEDRTRSLQEWMHFESPESRIQDAAGNYARSLWDDQETYVEVWVEKEALAGVVERVCGRNDVPYFSCRGYVSQSEMHAAGRRLADKRDDGKEIIILHLGDHDPSGIDMSRDIECRLGMFMTDGHDAFVDQYSEEDPEAKMPQGYIDECSEALTVKRIALNMPQIRQYNPPPNPAKVTDSRAKGYIEKFGASSWELDALDPAVLDALIQSHISQHRDSDVWNASLDRQREEKQMLLRVSRNWETVVSAIGSVDE